ncbi:ribonuclease H-like domain-containing protein [Aeoliella sp. SH292]|uniref:ribonuclease H-like domain-containing protein n=1 Tax=Aeoliella sp. SH292 TaxID=3454464 RepID=UPI003F98B0F0
MDESLYRRLEALNRGELPAPTFPRANGVPRAKAATPASMKATIEPRPRPAKLAGLLDRGVVTTTDRGEHLTITLPVAEIWPAASDLLHARYAELVACLVGRESTDDELDVRQHFVRAFPTQFVGLDLETCGLSGSALFLVGLVRYADEAPVVELLFARNYAEEAAVLHSLGTRLATAQTLVTFNGKSFDWPMVTDRWHRHLLHRTAPLPTLSHYDVLHHARRRWRGTLPDCKLQTIERMICRRTRTGDIAGHLIPGAYDHYVQTGTPREMEQVLYHNAVDLVTLLDIAMRLAG